MGQPLYRAVDQPDQAAYTFADWVMQCQVSEGV
jgi:hypothetical protein